MTPVGQTLRESLRAREREAQERLVAATGGQSLCALAPGRATRVPAVKYHEGSAAALADVRRAFRGPFQGPASDRAVLLDVRARWKEQSLGPGRTGSSWIGYLAGGLNALDCLIDDVEDDDGQVGDLDALC